MDASLKMAAAQGLAGLCSACVIFTLTNRRSAKFSSVVAFFSSSVLSLMAAHWSLGYVVVLASVPLFAATFGLCMVSTASHHMPEPDRRRVERFLTWDDICTCG